MRDFIQKDYSMENVRKVLAGYSADTNNLQDYFEHRAEYMTEFLEEEFGME